MANPSKPGLSDNFVAAVAYFTPVIPIFFLAIQRYNKRPYVRFHAWQSLLFNVFAITVGYMLVSAFSFFPFLGGHVRLAIVCLALLIANLTWLWCVVSAMRGSRFKLPAIGNWADEQAYR